MRRFTDQTSGRCLLSPTHDLDPAGPADGCD